MLTRQCTVQWLSARLFPMRWGPTLQRQRGSTFAVTFSRKKNWEEASLDSNSERAMARVP